MKSRAEFNTCADRLRALADPERLRIVKTLYQGPRHVSELAELLKSEVANISHHLSVLRHENLVLAEKQGRFMIYRLHPDILASESAADAYLDLGCCRLELSTD